MFIFSYRLVTTAVSLIDPAEDIGDITTPTPRQNPILTKTLQSDFDDNVEGLESPRTHQSNLLNQLQANNNGIYEGLSTPRPHQSNLLNQLKANNDGTFEGLSAPQSKQSNLLRLLKANHNGIYKGLSTPSAKQDYLLRLLQAQHNENLDLKVPTSTLPASNIIGLSTPKPHQSNLLRQLKANQNENLELKTPNPGRQNPLLLRQNLKQGHNERIKGLQVPSHKQNTLLRNLQSGHTREDDELNLPINPLKEQPFRPSGRFNPDGLNLPRRRQNPLLRILRFDKRERILSKGLTPPRYRQNPLFRQLVRTPQKYQNDFLQLPPKQQNKLIAILSRHGGDNFNANALLALPNSEPEEFEIVELPKLDEELFLEEKARKRPKVIQDFRDLLQAPKKSDELEIVEMPMLDEKDHEDEVEEYYDDEDDENEYETDYDVEYSTSIRHRPIMPKSKFEIFINQRQPVEEVTFQRVNEPLTLKDKKEGKPVDRDNAPYLLSFFLVLVMKHQDLMGG